MSVGMPYASYEGIPRQRPALLRHKNGDVKPGHVKTHQAVLADCERATYKAMKKLASPA